MLKISSDGRTEVFTGTKDARLVSVIELLDWMKIIIDLLAREGHVEACKCLHRISTDAWISMPIQKN